MKQSSEANYWLIALPNIWLIVFFIALLTVITYLLSTSPKGDIIAVFFIYYFSFGMILEVESKWDRIFECHLNRRWGFLALTYFQIILTGLAWPLILISFLIRTFLRSWGIAIQTSLG